MMPLLVPATVQHAEALAETMRPEDAAEVLACGYLSPLDALLRSMACADVTFAGLIDGEVATLFGVSNSRGGTLLGRKEMGVIWFLTGEAFGRHPRGFVRIARRVIAELLQDYEVLGNFIDARYGAAMRWARWLGFTLGEPIPYGPKGALFVPAYIRRSH